ncbi:MAG: tetratricopeptide repeat protein [Bacteroidales bacterium]|nr:tetratricopeptide repeat protein [Bacteroidales bacterium]
MSYLQIIIMLLCLIQSVLASDLKKDSLELRLENLSNHEKVDTALSLANMNIDDSPEKAIEYCIRALELATRLNYKHGEGLAAFYLGKCYLKSDKFDEALKYNNVALQIFEERDNDTMMAQTEIEAGLINFMKPNIEQAVGHFSRAKDLYSQQNDSVGISVAFYNLGRCYRKTSRLDLAMENSLKSLSFHEQNNHNALNIISIIYAINKDMDKALEYQEMALKIREKLELKDEIIGSLNNLGLISIRSNKLDKGLEYLLRSAKIAEDLGKKSQLNRTLNNIGFLYGDYFNDHENALKYYKKSLKVSKEINDKFESSNTYINIGILQSKLRVYDSALFNFEKGLNLAKEIKANEFIKNAYISISQHYERAGDYRLALDNYKSFMAIKDSIFNKESENKITEMQIKYESEKKEKENEIYRLQIEKHNLQKNRLYLGLILFFLIVIVIYFRYIMKSKSNKLLMKEIQEREKIEDALRAANDDLNAFSYSVSHDLRAPLRAIDGFSKMILESHSSEIDPEVQRLLHLIPENVKKMNTLISDLLSFSKIGRKNANLTKIDMSNMVNSICNELVPEAEKGKIQLNVMQLPHSYGDPSLIHQVWINLISNAIKYSSGKPISIIHIGIQENAKEQIYFVRDNGVGFDMKYANQLFKVFQRLHNEKEFEGTGVGLAIVHKIIQKHGGKIWVEAEKNKGATFYFTIPIIK